VQAATKAVLVTSSEPLTDITEFLDVSPIEIGAA
jgi:hypothetical protein